MAADPLFDIYKKDLEAVAASLGTDFVDPSEDLKKATTYLERCRLPEDPEAWKQYFLCESLPKLLKAVLTRKYSSTEAHVQLAKVFLVECAGFIADKMELEVSSLLCLFDPQQPFFKSHGFPKVPEQKGHLTTTSTAGQPDMGWIHMLTCDNYLDAQINDDIWEIVRLVEFSPTQTEVYLEHSTGKKWLSINAHARALAPFGTKTCMTVDADATNNQNQMEEAPEMTAVSTTEATPATAADITDCNDGADLWRLSVVQGTLLDCLDKSNVWYQACVMETKIVEVDNPIMATAAASVGKAVPVPESEVRHAEPQASACLLVTNTEGDQAKQGGIPTAASVTLLGTDVATAATVQVGINEAASYAEGLPVSAPVLQAAEQVWSNDMDVQLQGEQMPRLLDADEPAIQASVVKRNVVRIAYLGWAESYDEWIEIDSTRLAAFNSKSMGKRGILAIRDEVLFLIRHEELVEAKQADEVGKFALIRDHCFLSPYYVEVMQNFKTGFQHIRNYLRREEPQPATNYAMQLIQLVGQAAPVLSKPCLDYFAPEIIPLAANALRQITLAELRLLTIENLEACLASLEALCIAHKGRTEAMGALIEPLYLDVALNNLTCPYLLNRLGGLKMLSEVVARIQAAKEHPRGLRVDRKVSSSGVETISYRVVPITHHLTLPEVCRRIVETSAVEMVFKGDQSHDSLMARSGEVIKALAAEGQLHPRLVEAVWEAGFVNQGAVALRVLVDMVAYMEPEAMEALLSAAQGVEAAGVTTSLVDVMSAMAARCKAILMRIEDAPYAPTPRRVQAMRVHSAVLERLWNLVDGGQGGDGAAGGPDSKAQIDTAVVDRCLVKMESILELGVSPLDAQLAHPDFPWSVHWSRCKEVLRRAIEAVAQNRSTVPALRILQSFIASWPQALIATLPAGDNALPFEQPTASHVAAYLNESQDIIESVAKAILDLKRRAADETRALVSAYAASSSAQRVGKFLSLPLDLEARMNEALLGHSRIGYSVQLTRCLEFVHSFARCSDTFTIPQSVVERVWMAIVEGTEASTAAEVQAVVTFLGQIVIDARSASVAESIKAAGGSLRKSVCTVETVRWVFSRLLCNVPCFISSPHYSKEAIDCTERYFKWLNAEAGNLQIYRNSFAIVNATELFGTDVFYEIVLSCAADDVADKAVRYLTCLPQSLSAALVASGEMVAVCSLLLKKCLDELGRLQHGRGDPAVGAAAPRDQAAEGAGLDRSLRRLLMLIHGLLDESSRDCGPKLRPLGSLGKGAAISLKVTFTGKLKHFSCDLEVHQNDTVGPLLAKIAKAACKTPRDIKVMHAAKPLDEKDAHRTLAQMKIGVNGNRGCVMVAPALEHRASAAVSDERDDNAIPELLNDDVTPPAAPAIVDGLPAMELSRSPEHMERLFALLESRQGPVCDEIWGLFVRLPCMPAVLAAWSRLDCAHVSDMLYTTPTLQADAGHQDGGKSLCRLLYNLKVIEWLLQPGDNAAEMAEQRERWEDEVTWEGLQAWPALFGAKGGYQALAEAFELVVETLLIWTQGEGKSEGAGEGGIAGVSPCLLLECLALTLKIFRAMHVRAAVSQLQHSPSEEAVRRLLREWPAAQGIVWPSPSAPAASTEMAGGGSSSSFIGPMMPPAPSDAATALTAASADDVVVATPMDTEASAPGPSALSDVLGSEWGWRLGPAPLAVPVDLSVNAAGLQSAVLHLLPLLRVFSASSAFILDPRESDVVSARAAVSDRQEALMGLLNNAVASWGCTVLVCPDVLERIREEGSAGAQDIAANALLRSLFAPEDLEPSRGNQTLKAKVVKACSQALRMVVPWSGGIAPANGLDSAASPRGRVFVEQLFLAAAAERPPLSLAPPHAGDAGGHGEALLVLAAFVLDHVKTQGRGHLLDTPRRLDMCVAILAEIRRVDHDLRSAEGSHASACSVQHLAGTLQLLARLCADDDDVLGALMEHGLLPLLLEVCLGMPQDNPGDAAESRLSLCKNDNEARGAVYTLVLALCHWRKDIALAMQRRLQHIHARMIAPGSFLYRPESEVRSATGHVGLRNMGCTCYMNSLLQQLFMLPSIRRGLLRMQLAALPADQARDNILVQLQRLFCHLQFSEKKAFSPDDWVYSYKDDTGLLPVNVMQQQDAQEFLGGLCARLEGLFAQAGEGDMEVEAASSAGGEAARGAQGGEKNLFRRAFGGRMSQQIVKTNDEGMDCDGNNSGSGGGKMMREATDAFEMLTVEVKGLKDLGSALEAMVQAERVDGFQWDDKPAPPVTISKRVCIAEMADTVIFHLKRFEYNYDTFRREKINDAFAFPLALDMRPYTKEGLEDREGVAAAGASGRPAGYYEYELGGVVIHTGTADSGHYYSYIKDGASGGKWLEFNDSEVRDFSADRIKEECFGGLTSSVKADGDFWVTSDLPNPKSAYMLVYHRARPLLDPEAAAEPVDVAPCLAAEKRAIEVENAAHAAALQVFSLPHVTFVTGLFGCLQQAFSRDGQEMPCAVLQDYVEVLLRLYSRSALTTQVSRLSDLVYQTLERQRLAAAGLGGAALMARHPLHGTAPDLDDDEAMEAAAIAMSLQSPASTDDPADPAVSGDSTALLAPAVPSLEFARASVAWLANEEGFSTVVQLLYASDKDTRMGFVRCLLSLLQTLAMLEDGGAEAGSSLFAASQHAALYFSDTSLYFTSESVPCVIRMVDSNSHSSTQPNGGTAMDVDPPGGSSYNNSNINNIININSVNSIDDGPMSVESERSSSREPDLKRSRGNDAEALVGDSSLLAQFLTALTTKPRLVLLAENWRKADACLWLLRQLIGASWAVRVFLAKRELITELVDVFLGDSSPICGERYIKGDRKRCPSSFVAVWALRDGSPSHAAKSVPDWTELLEALTSLLCSCRTAAMVQAEADIQADIKPFSSPPTLTNSPLVPPTLDDTTSRCVSASQLLSSMLRQSRYTPSTIRLVLHLSYECRQYSERACEAIGDALQQVTLENTAHLFEVAERLLNLEDSLSDARASELFSPVRGVGFLLRLWKDDPLKQRLLCVCIRSVLALVHACPRVKALVRAQLDSWSWMIKFIYQMVASNEVAPLCLPSAPVGVGKESEGRVADVSSSSFSSSSAYPTALATYSNPQPPPPAPFFPNTGVSSKYYTVREDDAPFNKGDVVVRDADFLPDVSYMDAVKCTRVTDQKRGDAKRGNLQSFDPMAIFKLLPTYLDNQLGQGATTNASASASVAAIGAGQGISSGAVAGGSTEQVSCTPSATTTTAVPPVARPGPYLLVYGEESSDREASWLSRCENTRDILLALFTEMGADMGVLIAEATSAVMMMQSQQSDGSRSKPIVLDGHEGMPGLVANENSDPNALDDAALEDFMRVTYEIENSK